MGSDARVYVFDYERYVREVVPIVHEWLRTLHLEDPFDRTVVAWDTRQGDQPVGGTELLAHSTTLGADLRFLGEPNMAEAWFDDWDARRCLSATCQSRVTCPWHQLGSDRAHTANRLVAWLVARSGCIGDRAFVGRTATVGHYATFLDSAGHPADSLLRRRLDALGSRGRLIGYMWAGSAEGIHGWLDADEAADVANELDTLELPDVGPTPHMIDADLSRRHRLSDQTPFEVWSLAVVRAIARLARAADRGLLWANDLPLDTTEEVAELRAWYEGLTEAERNPPRRRSRPGAERGLSPR